MYNVYICKVLVIFREFKLCRVCKTHTHIPFWRVFLNWTLKNRPDWQQCVNFWKSQKVLNQSTLLYNVQRAFSTRRLLSPCRHSVQAIWELGQRLTPGQCFIYTAYRTGGENPLALPPPPWLGDFVRSVGGGGGAWVRTFPPRSQPSHQHQLAVA